MVAKKWVYTDSFLDNYKTKQPPWGPLGFIVYRRTYSRWIASENRYEQWWETVRRVLEGNYNLKPDDPTISTEDMEQAFDDMFHMRWLPAGRGLWISGTQTASRVGASLVNCWAVPVAPDSYYPFGVDASPIKASTPFVFAADRLMLGGGLGYDVTKETVAKFSKVRSKVDLTIVCDPRHPNIRELDADFIPPRDRDHTYIRVADSRRGWTDALRVVVDASFKKTNYDYQLIIDVSDVRASGKRIKGFGGTSSGPAPLVRMLRAINKILNAAVGRKITTLEAMDIMGNVAKCVVSGNVRRSATLAMGSSDDMDFIEAKLDADKLKDVRWTANISIAIDDAFEAYERIVSSLAVNGEPGIINVERSKNYGRFIDGLQEGIDSKVSTTNPCFTGDMKVLTSEGYKTFKELYDRGGAVEVLTDNRITYSLDSDDVNSPSNWVVDLKAAPTTTARLASAVRLTQKNAPIVEVNLNNGSVIKCTPDHHFATHRGMVEAQYLTSDDKVLIPLPEIPGSIVNQIPESVEESLALLMGLVAGDGYVSKGSVFIPTWGSISERARMTEIVENCIDLITERYEPSYTAPVLAKSHRTITNEALGKTTVRSVPLFHIMSRYGFTKETKQEVPEFVHQNWRYAFFYLAGLSYADGTVNISTKSKSIAVRISQSNLQFLRQVQTLLHQLGIRSRIYHRKPAGLNYLPDGKGKLAPYPTKDNYDLVMSGEARHRFCAGVGFLGHPSKEEKLQLANTTFSKVVKHTYCRVSSVKPIGHADVFCLTEPITHSIIVEGVTTRQCGEITLEPYEPCNLVDVFPYFCSLDKRDVEDVVRIACRYAKRVTFAPYDWESTVEVINRNRRIGVGISGWEDMKMLLGTGEESKEQRTEFLDRLYQTVKAEDEVWSEANDANTSIKLTTIKPSGTISNLRGASPGRHAHYAPFYIRRVRLSQNDPLLNVVRDANFPIVPDAYSPNTFVVEIPVKAPTAHLEGFRSAADYSLREQMEDQMELQMYWADNSVSSTLTFKKDEVSQIADLLREFKFKSTSLLPYDDHGYEQPPFEPISEEEYNSRVDSVKFWPSEEYMDKDKRDMDIIDIDDCAGGACPIR